MEFRMAVPADAPFITAFVNKAYEVEWALFGQQHDRTYLQEIEANLATPGTYFVLGAIAKTTVVSVRVDTQPDGVYFSMLSVDPSRQGSGVGRTVIGEVERLARERRLAFVRLNCIKERNLPGYYARLGYSATREEPSTIAGVQIHFVYMERQGAD